VDEIDGSVCCVPCAWDNSVQPLPNAFGLLYELLMLSCRSCEAYCLLHDSRQLLIPDLSLQCCVTFPVSLFYQFLFVLIVTCSKTIEHEFLLTPFSVIATKENNCVIYGDRISLAVCQETFHFCEI